MFENNTSQKVYEEIFKTEIQITCENCSRRLFRGKDLLVRVELEIQSLSSKLVMMQC